MIWLGVELVSINTKSPRETAFDVGKFELSKIALIRVSWYWVQTKSRPLFSDYFGYASYMRYTRE